MKRQKFSKGKDIAASRLIFLVFFSLFWVSCLASKHQCVILLHGLGRTHRSMSSLASYLNKNNYYVVNMDYPSTKLPIAELAEVYVPLMVHQCEMQACTRINFVTHSLGGIVLSTYLSTHKLSFLFRIIMLGPPNHGSKLADWLHNYWLYKFITGPAGQELISNEKNSCNKMSASFQLGIIAGNWSFINYPFNEANDGKVSVASTKLKYMKDFLILPVGHTFMMNNYWVQTEVVYFLKHGCFKRWPIYSHREQIHIIEKQT